MNLGFLASHNGSNVQAVIDACRSGRLTARPVVIISNNRDSGALERARNENIPWFHLSGIQDINCRCPGKNGIDSCKKDNGDVLSAQRLQHTS